MCSHLKTRVLSQNPASANVGPANGNQNDPGPNTDGEQGQNSPGPNG